MTFRLTNDEEDLLDEVLDMPRDQRRDHLNKICKDESSLNRLLGKLEVHERATKLLPDAAPAAYVVESLLMDSSEKQPTSIGQYQILELLGRGGMGTVYLAHQSRTEQKVALKTILLNLLDRESEGLAARFEGEIKTLGKLNHDSIARIYDANAYDHEGESIPYFVMEYVNGKDIAAHARDESLTIRERIELLVQVAEGVEHAHEQGVVHLDLKPNNVLIGERGHAKIVDFGVAKLLTPSVGEGSTPSDAAGGTFRYMSPEQLGGSNVDERTDVYTFGILAHELLVGELPFTLDPTNLIESKLDVQVQLHGQAENESPLEAIGSLVTSDLEAILTKSLQHDPEDRYQSMAEVGQDLKGVLEDRPVSVRSQTLLYRLHKFSRRRRALIASGVAALMFVGAILAAAMALVKAEDAREQKEEALSLYGVDVYDNLRVEYDSGALWPRRPETIPKLRDWLERAFELKSRIPKYEEHIGVLSAADLEGDRRRSWVLRRLKNMVALLDENLPEMVSTVDRSLEVAEKIKIETVDKFESEWNEAFDYIKGNYDGMEFPPIVGLVPLGSDSRSGLFEFWVWESGEKPRADVAAVPESGQGIVLVLLKGGEFLMGAEEGTKILNPPRRVKVAPFLMTKYEVTQDQWVKMTSTNPSWFDSSAKYQGRHPVELVGLDEAREALRKFGMSLPTETQWEYAARAGSSTHWGLDGVIQEASLEMLAQYANLADRAYARRFGRLEEHEDWNDRCGATTYAGKLKPNGFGLHHMLGNVWEWCDTLFNENKKKAPEFVIRGGSYATLARDSQVWKRRGEEPGEKRSDIGVRAVMNFMPASADPSVNSR